MTTAPAQAAATGSNRAASRRRPPINPRWWGLAFVTPAVLFFAAFNVFPVFYGLYLSLTQASLLTPPNFSGVQNYLAMADDVLFHEALANTLVFVLGSTVPVWFASLFAALLFNQVFPARNFLKTVFFLPVLPPVVVVAVIWKVLLDPVGVASWFVGGMSGAAEIPWLYDTTLAPMAMIIVHDWAAVPFYMMIWLAGLATLSPEMTEAAHLDGAGAVRTFWHIELPQLKGTAVLVCALSSINAFQTFTLQFVLSNDQGGPINSTLVLGLLIFKQAFQFFHMGYAAAISVVLFLMIFAVTLVQIRLGRHAN
jgi:ABC-type sugar transport system permease subunit